MGTAPCCQFPAACGAPTGHTSRVFERFTEPARRALVLAQEQARSLGHAFIGTEHILLGLLAGEDNVAAQALEALGLDLARAKNLVIELVGKTAEAAAADSPPFTPRAKKALEMTLREALELRGSMIEPPYMLLGLLRVEGCSALRVMELAELTPEQVRAAVLERIDGPPSG